MWNYQSQKKPSTQSPTKEMFSHEQMSGQLNAMPFLPVLIQIAPIHNKKPSQGTLNESFPSQKHLAARTVAL